METGYLAPSGKYLDVSFLAVCLLILFFFAVAPVLLLVFPVPFPVTIFVPQTAALILLFLCAKFSGPADLSLREKTGWSVRHPFPWKTVFSFFLFVYVLSLLLSNAVQRAADFFSIHLPDQMITELLKTASPSRFAMIAASAVILAPLTEEWMYRHIFYSRLAHGMRWETAAAATSLLFALLHGSVLHGASLFCLGLVLQIVYRKTGGIAAPVLIHMLFNGTSVAVLTVWKLKGV